MLNTGQIIQHSFHLLSQNHQPRTITDWGLNRLQTRRKKSIFIESGSQQSILVTSIENSLLEMADIYTYPRGHVFNLQKIMFFPSFPFSKKSGLFFTCFGARNFTRVPAFGWGRRRRPPSTKRIDIAAGLLCRLWNKQIAIWYSRHQ